MIAMDTTREESKRACKEQLERFFRRNPDAALEKSAIKALRFLAASDVKMKGKPAGWAAGIIYALANRGRQACGVPGLLNRELEGFFDVSMSTVRKRAAQVERALEI
jgi:hypothetical protein